MEFIELVCLSYLFFSLCFYLGKVFLCCNGDDKEEIRVNINLRISGSVKIKKSKFEDDHFVISRVSVLL